MWTAGTCCLARPGVFGLDGMLDSGNDSKGF